MMINEMKKIVIVGKGGCPRCDQAKQLCQMAQVKYDYKVLFEDIQMEQLEQIVGGRVQSVPQIFASDNGLNTYIGGYKELHEFLSREVGPDRNPKQEVL